MYALIGATGHIFPRYCAVSHNIAHNVQIIHKILLKTYVQIIGTILLKCINIAHNITQNVRMKNTVLLKMYMYIIAQNVRIMFAILFKIYK